MRLNDTSKLLMTLGLAWLAHAAFAVEAPPSPTPPAPANDGIEFFEKKIRPVLVERCYSCHSAESEKLKGALRLDYKDGVLKGGENGPAIVPGNPDKSLLIKAIRFKDDDLLMPPKKKLEPQQIADFEAWVKMGAPDPRTNSMTAAALNKAEMAKKHWAFQLLKPQEIPAVKTKDWAKTPVDNFILAKLEEKNLKPSPLADKRMLLRRATFDLIGMPPTPDEYAAFEADNSPDAFAKVVDRLLASPHYGERWGRYWLDVARYADTKGYVFEEERRYPYSYTYRDWVVQALNSDLPYDQFLIQQIAADRLPLGEDKHALAAMGFLTLGRRFLNQQPDIIDDRLDVLCRGTMALTVGCARCHDHKFDPIPTADYYSLYGVFASSKEPTEPPVIGKSGDPKQLAAYEEELAKKRKDVQNYKESKFKEHLTAANKPDAREANIKAASEGLTLSPHDLRKAAEAKKLDPFAVAYFRQELKAKKDPVALKDVKIEMTYDEGMKFIGGEDGLLNGDDHKKIRDLQKLVDGVSVNHPGAPPRAMMMEDLPQPVKPHIFKRGNQGNPGDEVPRQFLSVLSGDKREPFKDGSGRLELAKAIANKNNPLTARVMVNRVWLNHFGMGMVRTPSDFGLRSEPPSHPQLLDFLANRFMEEGWSLKKLHRQIMLSSVYQQRSDDNPAARAADPENVLLWRMNRRRLDFEATRDSLIAVSGQLDDTMGGKAVDLNTQPFTLRRTIYGFIDRQNLPSMFRAFDFASPDTHSPGRFVTTVPQQALFMMNSPFVVERSRQTLNRPELRDEKDTKARISKLYMLLYGRKPDGDELSLGEAFINEADKTETIKPSVSAWQYGYGEFDEAAKKVKTFTPLPTFTGDVWQGGKKVPDPKLGWVLLSPLGGHPGNDNAHASIRRWIAPRDGTITISGKLAHPSKDGNGILGRIVASGSGEKGWWTIHGGEIDTKADKFEVKAGETVDFLVDPRGDPAFDSYTWAPVVKMVESKIKPGPEDASEWNSTTDFKGPEGKKPTRLTAWEKYVQVLLESNEFVFVD